MLTTQRDSSNARMLRICRPVLAGLVALAVMAPEPALAQRRRARKPSAMVSARNAAPKPMRGANCFGRLNCDEKGHSLTNAYLLALVSHQMYPHAYKPNPGGNHALFELDAKPLFESWGMDVVELREVDNVQYAVMSNEEAIIVAFRGSDAMDGDEALEDWVLTDANCVQRLSNLWGTVSDGGERKNPGVHTGFYNAYSNVRDEINERIRAQGGKSKKLFITGHSLGGALATLCALDQGYAIDRPSSRRFVAQGVYTFGAPRVGNGLFVRLYDAKPSAGGAKGLNTHRYVNMDDIVPMTPPDNVSVFTPLELYGLGEPFPNVRYEHVGRTCNIKPDGRVVRDDKEFRGIGRTVTHHSKHYARRLYFGLIARKSWADKLPAPPVLPLGA